MARWVEVCAVSDIEPEDVVQFAHQGREYAIYNSRSGFYASDDLCTHQHAHLSNGLVIGDVIECPLHQGRFHIPSGKALSPPACVHLRTYPVKAEAGQLYIHLESEA